MDDPDVDHELIALLRESLGFSNKAQDGVSSNTGKMHYFLCHGYLHLAIYHDAVPSILYAIFAFAAVSLTRS